MARRGAERHSSIPALVAGEEMPDSINPVGIQCPQAAVTYTITTDGEGFGGNKQEALENARKQADGKGALLPSCPGPCKETRTSVEPPYDKTKPAYAPFGAGWRATLQRERADSVACAAEKAAAPKRAPREQL